MTRLIAITTPYFREGEADEISRLLGRGWERVHIRKPSATSEETEELISRIPTRLYSSISLHDHFHLAAKYGLGGIHLNSRNPEAPPGWTGLISRSCHSLEELRQFSHLDYLTLSPVFDSISKPGYTGRFNDADLAGADLKNVYALGGATRSRLPMVRQMGFRGAAMLSEAWKHRNEMLQFITHTTDGLEEALRGGCRWVQIRMKDATDAELADMAAKAIPLCHSYGAKVIIDDRVNLVGQLGADGVHLGKSDMPLPEARAILGPDKIIGATANTAADMLAAAEAGADYIGLGPLRFTTTKQRLSPIIGLEGYARIMAEVRAQGMTLPTVAIGGITLSDIKPLREAGLDGVAISGLILNSTDKSKTTEEILTLWKN